MKIIYFYYFFKELYQLSVKSNNLKEIFKQEQLENNIKKRQQKIINEKEQSSKNLLEQSNYYQVLRPYDNSAKLIVDMTMNFQKTTGSYKSKQ